MTTQVTAAVENIISRVTNGVGTIHMLAPYDNTLEACLSTIQGNTQKSAEFNRKFKFNVEVVIQLLPYVPSLKLNDLVIQRFMEGVEEPFSRVLHD